MGDYWPDNINLRKQIGRLQSERDVLYGALLGFMEQDAIERMLKEARSMARPPAHPTDDR